MKGTYSSSSIPSKTREMVQNLKEIVNFTEQEIYSMLRECNMDPNDTVYRLLNQGTFHEVKSKREKKKEIKASGESRSQRVSCTCGHGARVGPVHAGRSVPQINFNDCEVTPAKHMHVSGNGARIGHISPDFGSGGTTNNSFALSTPTSSSYNGDVGSTIHFPRLTDNISLPSQPSSTLQNKWLGVPGQLSMADVVKMRRSQRKPSNREVRKALLHQSVVPNTSEASASASARCISTTVISLEPTEETHSLHDSFKVTEGNNEPGIVVGQREPIEEWTFIDHSTKENYHEPSASTSLHIDEIDLHLSPCVEDIRKVGCVSGKSISTESTIFDGNVKHDGSEHSSFSDDGSFMNISCDHSIKENFHEPSASTSLYIDEIDLHLSPHVEDIRKLGHVSGKSISTGSTISDGHVTLDGSEHSSFSDDRSFANFSCDQQDEAEDVHEELSSATVNLHRLSLPKEEQDEASAIIIPSHLQDSHTDCPHLTFGSLGLGVSASKSNLEVTLVMENAPSVDYSDTGNLTCYNTEQLRTTSDISDLSNTSTTCRNSDVVSTSQPDLSRDDTPISEPKLQFNMPPISSIASSFTVQPIDVDYNRKHAQVRLQVQDFAQLTSLPQPHPGSTSPNLLTGNAQCLRAPKLPSLHFQANRSVPTKYIPAVPSFTGTTSSLPQLVKPGLYSNFQPIPQTTSRTSVPTHTSYNLPVPTYSQPILPPMANMFTYPGVPQNIAYMQSPASLQSAGMKYTVPQYKSIMPLNGLPKSLPVGSGYGGYGSSTSSSRTSLQNPFNVDAAMPVGYEEALRSQYKEQIPLQQDGNNSMFLRGLHSRPQPVVPPSSFYGIHDQGHQGSNILRQVQHPPQMGMTGNANLHRTRQLGGMSYVPQQLFPTIQDNLVINGDFQSSQQSCQGQNFY